MYNYMQVPGQVLLLQNLVSMASPEQAADPPVHDRCLSDRPPPQVLVQEEVGVQAT